MLISLFYFLIYCIEAFILKQYCNSLFVPRRSLAKQWSVLFLLYMILFFCSFVQKVLLNIFAFCLINWIYILFSYNLRWYYALFHAVMVTTIMGLSEFIVSNTFHQLALYLYTSNSNLQNLILLGVVSKQLYFFILYGLSRIYKPKPSNIPPNISIAFILISFLCFGITSILLVIGYYVELPSYFGYLTAFSSLLLLIVNIFIYFLFSYTLRKNEEFTQMHLQMQKESDLVHFYQMLAEQTDAQKLVIHDIKKHLYAISLLNNEHENQKISDYIERLTHSSQLKVSMRVCENDFLNAVFNRYLQRCEHLHITLNIDIRKQALSFMDEYDMTSLFCNLLDNAVEAATGCSNAFIEVYAGFSRSHNLLLLSVKNSCIQKPSIDTKGCLKTQKSSKGIHGTGLKSVLRVVKKYEGNYEFSYDDQSLVFSTVITLTNSKKEK